MLAVLHVLAPAAADPAGCSVHGRLDWLRPFGRHAFHDLVRGPGDDAPRLVAVVDTLPAPNQVQALRARARERGLPLTWLVLTGSGRPGAEPPERLVPAVLRLAGPASEDVRAVPLPAPAATCAVPAAVRELVLARGHGAQAAALVTAAGADAPTATAPTATALTATGVELLALPDPEPGEDDAAPVQRPGAVVLLSGLSGSGKSTVARAVTDLLRSAGRTVTLLDGDDVRRLLSAGLGFSREDRDLNVRRIGYVAAEVARHGGLAVAAPIAPYASVRDDVRAMAEQVGARFVLVHVSTPLEVCEQRDRKGLYAAARRGEITGFTGIDDPYEAPVDADLVVDTSTTSTDEAAAAVLDAVRAAGAL